MLGLRDGVGCFVRMAAQARLESYKKMSPEDVKTKLDERLAHATEAHDAELKARIEKADRLAGTVRVGAAKA